MPISETIMQSTGTGKLLMPQIIGLLMKKNEIKILIIMYNI